MTSPEQEPMEAPPEVYGVGNFQIIRQVIEIPEGIITEKIYGKDEIGDD